MKLHEFFNPSALPDSKAIAQHQAEIRHDTQDKLVNAGRVQEIIALFKTDPHTASHLLDYESQKAKQRIKGIEVEADTEIESSERERVMQLVQSISDISAYEESQLEVDRLVAQYMRNKSNH